MAEVKVHATYTLLLSSEDMRLVGLGLAGKIKSGSAEYWQARELNIKILSSRKNQIYDIQQSNERALIVALQEGGSRYDLDEEESDTETKNGPS